MPYFFQELSTSRAGEFGCATLEETHQTHLIFTTAFESNKYKKVVEISK